MGNGSVKLSKYDNSLGDIVAPFARIEPERVSVLPEEMVKFVSGFRNVELSKLSVREPAVITSCLSANELDTSLANAFASNSD